MATIKSQMVLNDGVSQALSKIVHGLDVTLAAFEQVQRAYGNAMDVAEIEEACGALADASNTVDEMADNYRRAAQEEDRLNQGIREGASAMDGLLGKVERTVMVIAGAAGVQKLFELSDQVVSTEARLSFIADETEPASAGVLKRLMAKAAGMQNLDLGAAIPVDDGGSVEALEAKIMASAQRSRAAYLDTANAIASMGANAGSAFSGNDELIAFMEQVNKQFVIGGASAQGQAAAMLQLTQAMAAGALRGEELNSILENAPGIARAIESYMGIAEGSIKKYAEEGAITAGVVKNALLGAADETNAKFDSMPMTWEQVWTSMQNQALSALDPVLVRINEIANSEQLDTIMAGVMNALPAVVDVGMQTLDVLMSAGTAIADNWGRIEPGIWGLTSALGVAVNILGAAIEWTISFGTAVADNWSWLEPVIWGVAAALGAYAGYLGVTKALELANAAGKIIMCAASYAYAAATGAEASAAAAATAAQYGFNTALLASPITWIVAGVIALISVITAVVRALDLWGAASTSVIGTICGLVAMAVAFIANGVLGLINALIQICWSFVTPFIGIVEWILNVCNGGFNSFGDAVASLIGQIISWFLDLGKVVTKIIDAIFGTDWTSGLSAFQDKVISWGKNEEAITLERNIPVIGHRIEYGDAFGAGAAFGDSVSHKLGGLLRYQPGTIEDFANQGFDSFAVDGLGGDVGAIADNTEGMAHALEVSGEELKYLRDIAERDAVNRFTTAQVKIDMSGMTNRIDSSNDLDGVIRELTDGFSQALSVAAEGVYQ